MPQEQKPEPTATFTAKAGLPGSPQPLEVHPPTTDIKPWDLDSVPQFEHMGQPRPRVEAPLKVTGKAKYTFDIKLPGHALRPHDRRGRARRRDPVDRHVAGRGAAGREGGLDHRLARGALCRPGRGGGRGRVARRRAGRGPAREGELQGAALHARAARGDEAGRAAGLRHGPAAGRPRHGPQRQRRRAARAAGRTAATSTRASPRPRWSHEGTLLLPRAHPRAARDARRRGRLGGRRSSRSTPRRRRSSRCARASPRRSASTARTCA